MTNNTHQQPSSKELEVNNTPQWVYDFNRFLIEERTTGEIIEFIQSLLTSHSQAIRERVSWYIGQTLNVYGAEHVVVGISTMIYDTDCEGEPEWKITDEIQEVAIAIKYPHTTYQKPCWLKVSELEKALALLNDSDV